MLEYDQQQRVLQAAAQQRQWDWMLKLVHEDGLRRFVWLSEEDWDGVVLAAVLDHQLHVVKQLLVAARYLPVQYDVDLILHHPHDDPNLCPGPVLPLGSVTLSLRMLLTDITAFSKVDVWLDRANDMAQRLANVYACNIRMAMDFLERARYVYSSVKVWDVDCRYKEQKVTLLQTLGQYVKHEVLCFFTHGQSTFRSQ